MTLTLRTDSTSRKEQTNSYVHTVTTNTVSSTVAAGSRVVGQLIGFGPTFPELTPGPLELINIAMRIRVDVDDEDHTWGGGSGTLTSGQRNLWPMLFNDDGRTDAVVDNYGGDDPPGYRIGSIAIANRDSSSHTYYLRGKVYYMREERAGQ